MAEKNPFWTDFPNDDTYTTPTTFCAPENRMYKVQLQSRSPQEQNMPRSINDWLDDAPMPSDYRYPSTSTEVAGKFDGDLFTPATRHDEEASKRHYNPETPIHPDIANLRLNTPPRKTAPATPEKAVVEVRPSNNPTLKAEVIVPNEVKPWCTIHYYEFAKRVGKPFIATTNSFTIDGATGHSNADRMCLSSLPPSKIQKCGVIRNQLGAGLRLSYENGVVWLTLLTDTVAFVLCPFRNRLLNQNTSNVLRLQNKREGMDENGKWITTEQAKIKLFDKNRFNYEQIEAGNLSPEEANRFVQGFCTSRISFCKGYGSDYTRKSTTEVPCWIEIILHEPFESLDAHVRSQRPCDDVGSRS